MSCRNACCAGRSFSPVYPPRWVTFLAGECAAAGVVSGPRPSEFFLGRQSRFRIVAAQYPGPIPAWVPGDFPA